MLPSSIREALFRMAQGPKVEHENQRLTRKADRSDYWKERAAKRAEMKPRVFKVELHRRLGKAGKRATQARAPLILPGTPRKR